MPRLEVEQAPAKVNLYLHVVGKRDDGYHLLDSLAVFANIGDTLEWTDAPDLSLSIVGPFAAGLAEETDNLVLQAAHLLAREARMTPTGHLVLNKNLPVSSGIGGGSADAAAALRLLARVWGLPCEPNGLLRLAARLGADVPVCIGSQTARMGGIGEQIEPFPTLPELGLLLINPRISVSTADVFRGRTGDFESPADLPRNISSIESLVSALAGTANGLQSAAERLCPAINDVLDAIRSCPGCLLARMSGSGATCFGVFCRPADAQRAAGSIAVDRWWKWGGGLAPPILSP